MKLHHNAATILAVLLSWAYILGNNAVLSVIKEAEDGLHKDLIGTTSSPSRRFEGQIYSTTSRKHKERSSFLPEDWNKARRNEGGRIRGTGKGKTRSKKAEIMDEKFESDGQCDIFSGRWVHDDSYPLYASEQCPYISTKVSCIKNGRPDSDYEKWRWNPNDCSIPRFNANDMLESMRGKRLMFVGDSLNRNQWESMVCLLQSLVPDNSKSVVYGYPLTVFTAQNYNMSVEFFWAPFLVDMYISEGARILRIDSIENNGQYWRGVDVLVFNSAHWWTHSVGDKPWDYIQEGGQLYLDMDRTIAYEKGLITWANWIDYHIDPQKTQVVFRSISPMHSSPTQWNGVEGHKCYSETEPIMDEIYLRALPPQVQIVGSVLQQMTVHVSFLNITRLSDYRKDAHPSVYGDLTAEQRTDPDHFADCSHWCVAGLPDIWNELLYSLLLPNFHSL